MAKGVFVFANRVTNDGTGALVAANSVEHAKELLAEPALVELGNLDSATVAALEFERELDDTDLLIVALTQTPVLTEARVMSARTSLEAFKNSELKLFGTERYLVAAKDADDAWKLLEEVVQVVPKARLILSLLKDNLVEQSKEQYEKAPKALSRAAVDWYKAEAAKRANEPLELPAPKYVM